MNETVATMQQRLEELHQEVEELERQLSEEMRKMAPPYAPGPKTCPYYYNTSVDCDTCPYYGEICGPNYDEGNLNTRVEDVTKEV